jgi:hypothetical protein
MSSRSIILVVCPECKKVREIKAHKREIVKEKLCHPCSQRKVIKERKNKVPVIASDIKSGRFSNYPEHIEREDGICSFPDCGKKILGIERFCEKHQKVFNNFKSHRIGFND